MEMLEGIAANLIAVNQSVLKVPIKNNPSVGIIPTEGLFTSGIPIFFAAEAT